MYRSGYYFLFVGESSISVLIHSFIFFSRCYFRHFNYFSCTLFSLLVDEMEMPKMKKINSMIRLLFFSCQLLFGCWDFWTFRMDQKNIGFFVFFLLASWIGTYRRKKVTTVTEVKRFFLRSKSLGGDCFQEIL